jgi:hypothetical protein
LVLASPASESPLLLVLVLVPELLPPAAELLELLLDPHAATTTAKAIATMRVSVSRNGRI